MTCKKMGTQEGKEQEWAAEEQGRVNNNDVMCVPKFHIETHDFMHFTSKITKKEKSKIDVKIKRFKFIHMLFV